MYSYCFPKALRYLKNEWEWKGVFLLAGLGHPRMRRALGLIFLPACWWYTKTTSNGVGLHAADQYGRINGNACLWLAYLKLPSTRRCPWGWHSEQTLMNMHLLNVVSTWPLIKKIVARKRRGREAVPTFNTLIIFNTLQPHLVDIYHDLLEVPKRFAHGCVYVGEMIMSIKWKQERPLEQRKTPPANKLHNVTSRLMSNTTREIYFYRIPLLYHLMPEWHWLWPFKVTQGQIYCAIRLPIYGFLCLTATYSPTGILYEIKGFEIQVT